MEIYKCIYEDHQNEAIIGFCLNSNCQNACQYCYQCVLKVHLDHHGDCIRFADIPDFINKYIQFQCKKKLQLNDIYNQIQNLIGSNIKRMDENIQALKDLNQLLTAQEYLKFKQQMNILKYYYSSEQQKKEDQFIKVIQLKYYEQINQIKLKKS